MADIALAVANKVHVVTSKRQRGEVAGADITAGSPYVYNASGAAIPGDANLAGSNTECKGVAVRTVKSGEGFTGVQEGDIDGYDFTAQAYGAPLYVSDTGGVLADAPGTASLRVGSVEPVSGQSIGSNPDKVLHVNVQG